MKRAPEKPMREARGAMLPRDFHKKRTRPDRGSREVSDMRTILVMHPRPRNSFHTCSFHVRPRAISFLRMTSRPPVTVCVLNWNSGPLLERCLRAINAQRYPGELRVRVVDNASTDDSLERALRHRPDTVLHRHARNLGFAKGLNPSLRDCDTPFIVLLNPDVFLGPDWIERMVERMASDADIAIAGCKLYYEDGTTLQHGGGRIHWPLATPGHHGVGEPDTGQCDAPRDVDYVCAAAVMLSTTAVKDVGLFDENYFMYYEDVDWCFRARAAGYRVVYEPAADAIHLESATAVKDSPAYLRNIHASRLRFLLNHRSVNDLLAETLPAEPRILKGMTTPDQRRALGHAYADTLAQLPPDTPANLRRAFKDLRDHALNAPIARLRRFFSSRK